MISIDNYNYCHVVYLTFNTFVKVDEMKEWEHLMQVDMEKKLSDDLLKYLSFFFFCFLILLSNMMIF